MGKYLDPTSKSSPYYEDGLFYVGGIATKNVGMQLVETASPSAASNFTISSLAAGSSYLLVVNVKQNTTGGNQYITFNSDTTSGHYVGNIIAAWNNTHGAGTNSYYVQGYYAPPAAGYHRVFIYFSTLPDDNNKVSVFFNGHGKEGGANTQGVFSGSILWSGEASLSTITYNTSGGTITGTASLYKLN
jgi:hypothetical protein